MHKKIIYTLDSKMSFTSVQSIREAESRIIENNTNLNEIISIKKVMKDEKCPTNLRLGALNSLRHVAYDLVL